MKNKNENRGWIKLHRLIQNNWIWNSEEPFDRRSAFIDLILQANHSRRKVFFKNEIIYVERGQTVTSIRKLCEKWNWSNTKVNNFLKLLESDGIIMMEKDTKKDGHNYLQLQQVSVIEEGSSDAQATGERQVSDAETTEERQGSDEQATNRHTNKNLKNFKNFAPPPPREGNLNHEIVELYFDVFGTVMNLFHYKTIENYINLHGFEEEAICLALTEAGENGADNFKYVIKILNEWHKQKAKTLEECQAILQRFQAKKNKSKATGGAAGGFHRNNSTEEEEPEDESIFNE